MTKADRWWRFTKFNTDSQFGFGTKAEAQTYIEWLNEATPESATVWSFESVPASEAQGIDANPDQHGGFNLYDELITLEGNRQ